MGLPIAMVPTARPAEKYHRRYCGSGLSDSLANSSVSSSGLELPESDATTSCGSAAPAKVRPVTTMFIEKLYPMAGISYSCWESTVIEMPREGVCLMFTIDIEIHPIQCPRQHQSHDGFC